MAPKQDQFGAEGDAQYEEGPRGQYEEDSLLAAENAEVSLKKLNWHFITQVSVGTRPVQELM